MKTILIEMPAAEYEAMIEQRNALAKALKQCLNYIEHKTATEGTLNSDEEWDRRVEEFRKGSTTELQIGRFVADGPAKDASCYPVNLSLPVDSGCWKAMRRSLTREQNGLLGIVEEEDVEAALAEITAAVHNRPA